MSKVPKNPEKPANEQDLHKSMGEGGVLFTEEPPIEDEEWQEILAKGDEAKAAKKERDRLRRAINSSAEQVAEE